MIEVLSYGGGRQTVAACVLIKRGVIPRPDRIVIADTGRENPSTWEYLEEHTRPMMRSVGLEIEIAPRSFATVDLYAHNGDLLIPVYTATGKLSAFCSNEWKAYVARRHLRDSGENGANFWIGFALDETNRIKKEKPGPWRKRYPLAELCLTKQDCKEVILSDGKPLPPPSSCFMCPNKSNEEWRMIRDFYPESFEVACCLDEEVRAEDVASGRSGVWLHHSRTPLRTADLEASDRREGSRQCSFGHCFV